ncbi:MAG: tetratricopeptide repeat protein [Cyanobacteria bacterium SBLK]|nr:tetratricopeptide repeat protein [Cyanobacteria bacterium SBLK]
MTNQPQSQVELTPEDNVKSARRALAQGQLSRAIFHLSSALSTEPQNPNWLDLLHQIIETAEDPFQLVPLKQDVYFALLAVRAYILAYRSHYNEAIYWLARVLQILDEPIYLPWISDWFSRPDAAIALTPETRTLFLQALLAKFPGDRIDNPSIREDVERITFVLSQLRQIVPDDEMLAFSHIALLRKLGHLEEALELAQNNCEMLPCWKTAVSLALVYRTLGDSDRAIDAYENALKFDSEEISVLLDMADLFCDTGRFEEGIDYYQKVLDREPEHPWAKPYFLYYQFFQQSDFLWKDRLQEYVSQYQDNITAAQLLNHLEVLLSPYLGYLPNPSDATINILHTFEKNPEQGPLETLTLTALESPSSHWVLQSYLQEKFNLETISVEIIELQTPDPRLPRTEVNYLLWHYQGIDPYPNIPPPLAEVAEAIAALAAQPYNLNLWVQRAREIASSWGKEHLDSFLGIMVHPPQNPREIPLWTWLHRIQVASALAIAYLDTGWQNSLRKKVLFDLARGPMDWTNEAAIIALMQLALEIEEASFDIIPLFQELFKNIPSPGYCPYLYGLICCSLYLPAIDDEFRQALEREKAILVTERVSI